MIKKLLLSILLISNITFSQRGLKNLPRVKLADFNYKNNMLDSLANAQILYDYGHTYFTEKDNYLQNVFEKTTRIQILTTEGKEHGVIKIPYYVNGSPDDEVIQFKATYYNLENGQVKTQTVDKKVLLENDINEWWKEKKYAFPNVKVGSIIEYSYQIASPRNFNLRKWYFQHDIPTKKSKYSINMCPYYNYIILKNKKIEYHKDTTYVKRNDFNFNAKDYDTKVYEWETNNTPAFKDDEYVTCEDDYLMSVEFQLESHYEIRGGKFNIMQTWEELTKKLLKKSEPFGYYLKSKNKNNTKVLERLNLSNKSNLEKINIIYNEVKNNSHWDGYHGIYTSSKKDYLKTKTGNVADINLYLCSLLKTAGINAFPILSSTRSHGKIFYEYPFLSHFNYVTVLVKNGDANYILDATDPLLPFNLLPKKCINGNGYGLIVQDLTKEQKVDFIPLIPTKINTASVNLFMNINLETDEVNNLVQTKLDGYNALNYRKIIHQDGEQSIQSLINKKLDIEINDLSFKKTNESKNPLLFSYKTSQEIDHIGEKIILTPFDKNNYSKNKLTQKTRDYPVDYGYLDNDKYSLTFQVPENYIPDYLPKNKTIHHKKLGLNFNYLISYKNNMIRIKANILRNKLIYNADEYPVLKTFYDDIEKVMNESIILKKKI